MKEMFKKLLDINNNAENRVVTRIDEGHIGEAVLVSDGELVWESEGCDFFASHLEDVKNIADNGVSEIDGVSVYTEILGREKKIVVCGGGHVSMPIIKIGKMIGCQVTCLEDRPLYANNARAAGADIVLCNDFEESLKNDVTGDSDTYFVIVTRGHRYDQECLRLIAQKPHAYIGLMGSKRRVRFVMEKLVSEGISKEVLDNVYTPIGLNIGSETPEEIAVAVMAEIIEVKNGRGKHMGFSKDITLGIVGKDGEPGKKGILTTIITRKGAAPRDVGTKMFIAEDGTCIDTIGGGCIESDVITKARIMMNKDDPKSQVITVSMTDEEAEDQGMVCGGVVDVLMQVVE